jgi:hypothetical protein
MFRHKHLSPSLGQHQLILHMMKHKSPEVTPFTDAMVTRCIADLEALGLSLPKESAEDVKLKDCSRA